MTATRLTVRLDDRRTALLQRLREQTGCDASEVIRRALDGFRNSPSPGTPKQASPLCNVPSAPPGLLKPLAGRPDPLSATTCQPSSTQQAKAQRMSGDRAPAVPSRPEKVEELLGHFRAFGMAIRPARRNLFQRLVAAAEVACESSDDPRDTELFAELLQLGNRYWQL